MAYQLGQYNKNKDTESGFFMTIIPDGVVERRTSGGDSGVDSVADIFQNECVRIPASLLNSNNYYFHGKIKRMTSSDQTFYVKLVRSSADIAEDNLEQYIKTITVSKGDPDEWVDMEFCFTPYDTFDEIMFELQRTIDDYREEVRYPIIIYEELSIVNNIIPVVIQSGIKLIKLGIQSRPGLLMCINGEEVRTCRTGIYELKNGVMLVSFFSVVAGAAENDSTMINAINSINAAWAAAEEIADVEAREAAKAAIGCRCFFGTSKTRTIDSFTLDYMYREE